MRWSRKPKAEKPPFEPATNPQKGSIWHNPQFFQPGDPEWDTAMGMMYLTGPPSKEESYSRLSKQQAEKVITYLRSFG